MHSLTSLKDHELLASLGELVISQRHLTSALIAHLAEMDSRRLHAKQGYTSLFEYCNRGHAKEWIAARFPRPDVKETVRKLPVGAATSPSMKGTLELLAAERFSLTVTVSREFRDELERLRDLLRHRCPTGSMETILEMALAALAERVERERFGRAARPRPLARPQKSRGGVATRARSSSSTT